MLNLKLTLCCSLMIIFLNLTGCSAQNEAQVTFDKNACSRIQSEDRAPCGDSNSGQITQPACTQRPGCCYDPNSKPNCYSNTLGIAINSGRSFVINTERSVAIPKPNESNVTEFTQRAASISRSLGVDNARTATIAGRASGISRNFLGLAINFPQCGVNTPMCQRVQCNSYDPTAETNPLACLSSPTCCFDRDLLIYRAIFGRAFMGGAPVCYYGPTAVRYQTLAKLIQPYNPFFQSIIVNLFREFFDTALNFQDRAICSITTALSQTSQECGWPGITKLECHLKGCCHAESENKCYYPTRFILQQAVPPQYENPYPELTSLASSNTCPANGYQFLQSFSPSIFRRLPCAQGNDALSLFASCRIKGCCFDGTAAIAPGLLNYYALTSTTGLGVGTGGLGALLGGGTGGLGGLLGGGTGELNTLLGGSLLSGISTGGSLQSALLLSGISGNVNTGNLIQQFFCPFRVISLPGFPDLTNSARGCCEIQSCYHNTASFVPVVPPISSCQWSRWVADAQCSVRCGTGQQVRRRECLFANNAQGCSSCPGAAEDTVGCSGTECGSWNSWSPYGSCQANCGGFGSRTSSRTCSYLGNPSNTCSGQATRQLSCQGLPCCQYTQWSGYSSCNAPCGRSGSRTRRRQCVSSDCRSCTATTEQQGCQGLPCCQYTQWSGYSSCNAPCGRSGSRTRRRQCVSSDCRSCTATTEQQGCQGPACCRLTSWSGYGSCSAVGCGQPGRQVSTRFCRDSNGRDCGAGSCPEPLLRRERSCPGRPCVGLGTWSTWSTCTNACRRERRRYCLSTDTNRVIEADQCGRSARTEDTARCDPGTGACLPVYSTPWITWGGWMPWGSCSFGCGGGTRYRERVCLYRGRSDSPLPSSVCDCVFGSGGVRTRQTQSCNTFTCGSVPLPPPPSGTQPPPPPPQPSSCSWGDWTSDCSSCNDQRAGRTRSRTCNCNDVQSDNSRCPGSARDPVDCSQTDTPHQWSSWSRCISERFGRVQLRCRNCGGRRSCPTPPQQKRGNCV